MSEKIKREDLFKLLMGFDGVRSLGSGGKLGYAIAKNRKAIMSELQDVKKVLEFDKNYEEYDKKRVVLCEKYCTKDDKDKPILKGNKYIGLDGNKEFKDKADKLEKENQVLVDKQKEKVDTFNKMNKEMIAFELHKVSFEDLPKEISVGQTEDIFLIIKEESKKEA